MSVVKKRIPRRPTVVIAGVALAGLTGAVLVSLTPPPAFTKHLLVATSGWMLKDVSAAPAIERHAHKVLGTYLEYAIAGKMARTVAAKELHDDVDRIEFAIVRAQARILSAEQVSHDPRDWPILISGLGYCDQVNSAVCQVLAHSFRRAQLFALQDHAAGLSLHTVGRVWSDQRGEWLYFDAFYDRPVIFRKNGADIEILNTPRQTFPRRREPPLELYRLPGTVMNEYPRSFAMYMVSKLYERQLPARPPISPALSYGMPAFAGMPASTGSAAYRKVAAAYVKARADDLFGDRLQAREEYLAIASRMRLERDPNAAVLEEASLLFAEE